MSHSTGPWKAVVDSDISVAWNIKDFNGGYVVGTEGIFRCDGEDEANARLIAAAPELLEACKALMLAANLAEDRVAQMKAQAAIAKAEGK